MQGMGPRGQFSSILCCLLFTNDSQGFLGPCGAGGSAQSPLTWSQPSAPQGLGVVAWEGAGSAQGRQQWDCDPSQVRATLGSGGTGQGTSASRGRLNNGPTGRSRGPPALFCNKTGISWSISKVTRTCERGQASGSPQKGILLVWRLGVPHQGVEGLRPSPGTGGWSFLSLLDFGWLPRLVYSQSTPTSASFLLTLPSLCLCPLLSLQGRGSVG